MISLREASEQESSRLVAKASKSSTAGSVQRVVALLVNRMTNGPSAALQKAHEAGVPITGRIMEGPLWSEGRFAAYWVIPCCPEVELGKVKVYPHPFITDMWVAVEKMC